MKGRKPIPTKLRLLRGTPKSKLRKNEPKPKPAIPSCPTYLDAIAKAEWKRLAKQCYRLGLLTNLDRTVFAQYCEAYSDFVRACKELKKQPLIIGIKDSNGNERPKINPWISVKEKASKMMPEAARELGLTPAARSRISVQPPTQEKDPFSEYETPYEKWKRQYKKDT